MVILLLLQVLYLKVPYQHICPIVVKERTVNQSPILIINNADTIRLAYRAKDRILYKGSTWRICMVDSSTVALAFINEYSEVLGNGAKWKIINTRGRKLSLWLAYLGYFDLYGESTITISGTSLLSMRGQERIYFEGDGDIKVTRYTKFNTPHYVGETIRQSDTLDCGGFFSIRDVENNDDNCIVASPARFRYSHKSTPIARQCPEILRQYMTRRASKFALSEMNSEPWPVGKLTAPQVLKEIRDFYGLNSFLLDPRIDMTSKGAFYCGYLPRDLSLAELLNYFECSFFHWQVKANILSVRAHPKYIRCLDEHGRLKKSCGGCYGVDSLGYRELDSLRTRAGSYRR